MKTKSCPNCGDNMIEDAWEDINVTEEGTIEFDAYPAFVCEAKCGYIERTDGVRTNFDNSNFPRIETPNLFQFGKSELSQDAFLCWLISWGDKKYRSIDSPLHKTALHFLAAIFELHNISTPEIKSIKITQQYKHLDILVIINDTYAILIEDKIDTKNHSNQLVRYREVVKKSLPGFIQLPIYYKTADQSHYRSVVDAGYLPFQRKMMLDILKKGIVKGVRNQIYHDYYRHLQKLENSVAAYRVKPVSEWEANQWKGFYIEVQKNIPGGWDYVSNPNKGFWGFWCSSSPVNGWYLQLEQEKLCIKIKTRDDKNRIKQGRAAMEEVLRVSSQNHLQLQKPSRLRAGKTMTIAQRMNYIQTNEEGIINLEKTIEELMRY